MRGYRPSGESDLDYEDEDEGYRPRPKRPAPGKVTRTMRMEGRVIARRSTGDGDGAIDTSGMQGLLERTSGGGQALPDSLRGSFEESLGVRLADVRLHTGSESAEVARSISAKAFTVGQDIHFAAGQYDPSSAGGKHLIAHEVAHTAQQAVGGTHVHTKLEVSQAGDAIESEADAAADAMVAGQKATVSAAPIAAARTPDGNAAGASDPNAGASARADKPNTVTVSITPKPGKMEFDAETYLDLYKQIADRAANNKCCGQCICAADLDTTAIDKYQIKVTVTLEKQIPSWKQIAKQPKEHQDKFNAWAASVKTHEDTHYTKYETAYNTLKTKLLNCADQAAAEKVFKEVDDAVEKDQKAFDDNKANQPAPLPIPGGVEKIDSTPGAKKNATDDAGADADAGAGAAEPIARKASGDGAIDTSGVQGLRERTRGGGSALPDSLRESFEESLGVRLGGVRVHTDGESAAVARSISAKAFAVGQDIYFGAGQYDPTSAAGKHLIAHEVAHTAQQAQGVHTKMEVSQASDAIEIEADAAADAMVAGHKATVSRAGASISRKGEDDEEKKKIAEEIEKFKQGPAVTKTIKPEGGLGLFESVFTPSALSLVATLKVMMIFESGKREEYEDAGFPPEAFIWTPAEAEKWKTDFVTKVKAGWSGKHPIKAGKPGWEKVAVNVTVNVDVQKTDVKKPVKDIDPDHAIDPPQEGTHWTIVVGKYPPRSVRMKTSSVSPRGTHHGKDDNGRNGVFPNKGGEAGGTVRMDSNDLRPEEKDNESTAERTALQAVFFHPHTEVPMNEMAVHSAARSLQTKGKDGKGGAGNEDSHLVVTGHASPDDAVTSADDSQEVRKQRNMEIANKRASVVSEKLQELGVPADKLVVRTVGEDGTLGISLGPDSANPKDCRVDLELSKTPTQVGALHEVGHMLGSPDEYHEPGAQTANVMAKGNKIQAANYAPFAQAMNEIAPGVGWSA